MNKIRTITAKEGERHGLGDWHTHLPVLAATLFNQRPMSILELGSGDYSTMLFNTYAAANPEARVLSLENDFNPGWIDGLKWMERPNHEIRKVGHWNHADMDLGKFDFVFIDQGPECDRIPSLDWFSCGNATTVALHDCNYPDRYDALLERFPFVLHHKTHRFHTAVASHEFDVTNWL